MEMCSVEGVEDVIKRTYTAKGECAEGMERGLVKGGLFIQKKSQQVVPVDTGALKNSAFTRKEGKGFNTKVTVGYTMHYAVYVHENLEAHHAAGKIAKFLEKPMKDYRAQVLEIIREEASKRRGNMPYLPAPPGQGSIYAQAIREPKRTVLNPPKKGKKK